MPLLVHGVTREVEIAYFLELTRNVGEGPYDVSIVEGSISTPHDEERIRHVRDISTTLVTDLVGEPERERAEGDDDQQAAADHANEDALAFAFMKHGGKSVFADQLCHTACRGNVAGSE